MIDLPPAPRISVIIPTYNGYQRLQSTIRSVLKQELPPVEIVVIDDGSTDDTPGIEAMFPGQVRYFRVANGGQQRARNYGVARSTGDWLAFLDHDDLWEPGYLAEVSALVQAHRVDATICNSRTWQETPGGGFWKDNDRFVRFAPPGDWGQVGANPHDRWTTLERYDYRSYLQFHPSQTSMFAISRPLYERLGGFDERMRGSGAENFEFEMRALRVARVGLIGQTLVTMVRHGSNASLDGSRMSMDLVDCYCFALLNHGLDPAEERIVEVELQHCLPAAIDGAFTLGELQAIREYRRRYHGTLPPKTRVKTMIACLPSTLAGPLARVLSR